MDFDELKNVWEQAKQQNEAESEKELNQILKSVTTAQHKIKRYFKLEVMVLVSIFAFFVFAVCLANDIEPYFYKLAGIVFLGSIPLTIRIFLSLQKIMGIDFSDHLRKNLFNAKNHLKTTIVFYYSVLAVLVISLVLMSWSDNYFLQLSSFWQAGTMFYFLLITVSYIVMVDKHYGKRLRELEELLAQDK
jgi:ABC-type sulfate transport system permease subunit